MNIRVDLNYPINDGSEVIFRSPVDCSQVTGLIMYYPGTDGNIVSREFVFGDAHGNNVGDIDHLFAENVVVKVILDLDANMAYVQNADTNAYLEGRFSRLPIEIMDKLCPAFEESGSVVTCEPVEGYPLTVTAEEGATTITRCGKNLVNLNTAVIRDGKTPMPIVDNGVVWKAGNDYFFYILFDKPLPVGTKVYVSWKSEKDSLGNDIRYCSLTKEGNISQGTTVGSGGFLTASVPATGICLSKNNGSTKVAEDIIISDIMVSIDGGAYEPYVGSETVAVGETITASAGVNTIYADLGNVTVSGKADPVAIIEKLYATTRALTGV